MNLTINNKLMLICFSIIFFTHCLPKNKQKYASIQGEWITTRKSTHNTFRKVYFSNDAAVFNVISDTVLRFKYSLDATNRILILDDGHTKRSNKITKLTIDSLVFEKLWTIDVPQRFYRKK